MTSLVERIAAEIDKASDSTAWPIFKANLESLLAATKHDPAHGAEAQAALARLKKKVYNAWIARNVQHPEIKAFLLPLGPRLVQILPDGQLGSDLMEQIVTVLTMTNDTDTPMYNEWATQIVVDVVAR
jgi:hypothetical protein